MTENNKDKKNDSHIVDAENLVVDNRRFRITHYKMEEDGQYSHLLASDWGARDPIVNQSWDIVKERIRVAKEKVLKGEISPIAYYMEKCITDVSTLAKYTGMAKWKLKRHMKVKVFKKLNEETLKRYADFFEISVEELKDIDHLKL
ncbi:MAG TPA: hypothetical protein PKI01_11180 [Bacteroidales bacterium]|nr:hypothetical protein [Bacteroidales bacterium]